MRSKPVAPAQPVRSLQPGRPKPAARPTQPDGPSSPPRPVRPAAPQPDRSPIAPARDPHRPPRPLLGGPASALLITLIAGVTGLGLGLFSGRPILAATGCDDPHPAWLACEDFEAGDLGWGEWFAQSPWVQCDGCRDGDENPDRILLVDDPEQAHSGRWSLHMPAAEAAGYRGGSLTWRDCVGEKRPGCQLNGHEELYFRTQVRLAPDHEYVHHFLAVAGTRPNAYWESDGNAGCRPDGTRWAGTTLDFNARRELFFYTYFPDMRCDSGGYCSGETARQICEGCAAKNMPCRNRQECCWGNHFSSDPPILLPRDEWVCLEIHMRLNTPGVADGVMEYWINGALGHRQEGMLWRHTAELQLNKAWLMHYIAGGDADQSNRVWFDDVVVSTERIGCGDEAEPTEPPPLSTATATATGPEPTAVPEPSATATAVAATAEPAMPLALPWLERR